MAWRSLGRDAVNKNTKPLDWIDRESPGKLINCRVTPEFHQEIQDYCKKSHIKVSQLKRLLLAREIRQGQ